MTYCDDAVGAIDALSSRLYTYFVMREHLGATSKFIIIGMCTDHQKVHQ
jgi:hypothetical protein